MSTFKKTKVVMLPTNEKAAMFINKKTPAIMQIGDNKVKNEFWAGQHLYFLSDEEIKEGDWMLHNLDEKPIQWNGEETNPSVYGYKKIIATTDKSLFTETKAIAYTEDRARVFYGKEYLPQPSQSFIEKFVEEYNKGNVITEVLVEYEEGKYNLDELRERHLKGLPHSYDYCNLKINPKDNTITIRKKKDSLNRAELNPILELIREIATDDLDRVSGGIKNKAIERLKWIEENL